MKPYTWRAAILKSNLAPTTRHVLLTLSCYINDVGQSAYPSIKTLAKDTGLTERAVGTHLHVARDENWLRVSKHGFGGQKWANNEYFPQLPGDEAFDEVDAESSAYQSSEKVRARKAVGNALASGRLQKAPCVTCGSDKAEAHHDDYGNKLVVTWLCRPCHKAVHAWVKQGQEPSSAPSKKVRNDVPAIAEGKERGSEGKELGSGEVRNEVPTNYPVELSKELSNKSNKKPAPSAPVLPDWLPKESWNEWVEYRASIKAPLNAKASKLSIDKLAKLRAEGHDPVAVIDQSIFSGKWTDLYAIKGGNQAQAQPRQPAKPSRHSGFDKIDYSEGVDANGRF